MFKWRRAYQAGQYDPSTLLPVEVLHEDRTIEISVGVARVRIEGTPDAATLRVVLRALRAAAETET